MSTKKGLIRRRLLFRSKEDVQEGGCKSNTESPSTSSSSAVDGESSGGVNGTPQNGNEEAPHETGSECSDVIKLKCKDKEVVYEACGISTHSVGNIPSRNEPNLTLSPFSGETPTEDRLDDDSEGISEIEAPNLLAVSDESSGNSDKFFELHNSLDVLEEAGLCAEDYYASLFARCDLQKVGHVKVSTLLDTLRDLRALLLVTDVDDLNLSAVSTSSEELILLKEVFDPHNNDPDITLNTFTKGITSYLERRDWNCLSPIKCNSMMEGSPGDDINSWPHRRRSPRLSPGHVGERARSFIDLSRISVQNFSLEGIAGTSSSLQENGERDWRAEVSDLHLQIQKLSDDNVSLKTRVNVAQDENFNLLQAQRDELDKKDVELRAMSERIKRLERDLGDKNLQISSLEDRNTVLCNRNARLENECSTYLKERKGLVLESEEHKAECTKSLHHITALEDEISKLHTFAAAADKEWEDKLRWLNDRNDMLAQTLEAMSQKLEKLKFEKNDLETKLVQKMEVNQQHHHQLHNRHYNQQRSHQSPVVYQISHTDSFDCDISSDDIQTELLAVDARFPLSETKCFTQRFDVATQSNLSQWNEVANEDFRTLLLLTDEIKEILISIQANTRISSGGEGGEDDLCKVDQMPNGSGGGRGDSGSSFRGKRKKKGKEAVDGEALVGGKEATDQLTQSNATQVVREINQELAEFREQLKKSQELFSVLRYNSFQSITLTKSCPGLSIDPSDALNKSCSTSNNKSVSCGTQTDSPVIETPILAQKLSLRSPTSSDASSSHNHHHLIMSGTGLPDFMTADSLDNPSFDKFSDDGSVRVRDDLSMVLEVSEQETETSPGPGRRAMNSLEKAGSLNNRPKLTRMANTTEEPHTAQSPHSNGRGGGRGTGSNSSSSGGGHLQQGNHHLNVDDGLLGSDNDYVSATSSQAESVYLSLERPLKVTLGGGGGGSSKESSGGNYRSCASSISSRSRGGSFHASQGGGAGQDCDTASVVSEGNTTFGSPLSSPSSPYWTPSQGSSSQETLTPGDRTPGERTPVNEELNPLLHPYHSNAEISSSLFGDRTHFNGSPAHSEPSDWNIGMIAESDMHTYLQLSVDAPLRAVVPNGTVFKSEEWQQLREDKDQRDKEEYRKAQEEGNDDESGMGIGVEGGVPQKCPSAFALDEAAERYLDLLPDLADRLFRIFDTVREERPSATQSDLDSEDLERKFNHMAEVFQTEHINLQQRLDALSKEFNESQVNLKEISQSLKSSVSTLKDISKSNNPVPEDLLEVMKKLSSTSDEFELYSHAMCRNARRMGMMDVQNRLHKMLDVMILYVHIIRTKHAKLKTDNDLLHADFEEANKLLEENNIPFPITRALGSHLNNNNNPEKWQWDEGELENSQSDRGEDGDSEPQKFLQHLLGPKKSNAGINRRERPSVQEKRPSDNIVVRYVAEWYEVLRREFFWPWNLEQTIKVLKQGFSVILMILGLFVFLRSFLPSVSAIDEGCVQNPSFFKSIGSYFSYCGELSHDDTPVI